VGFKTGVGFKTVHAMMVTDNQSNRDALPSGFSFGDGFSDASSESRRGLLAVQSQVSGNLGDLSLSGDCMKLPTQDLQA